MSDGRDCGDGAGEVAGLAIVEADGGGCTVGCEAAVDAGVAEDCGFDCATAGRETAGGFVLAGPELGAALVGEVLDAVAAGAGIVAGGVCCGGASGAAAGGGAGGGAEPASDAFIELQPETLRTTRNPATTSLRIDGSPR